MFSVLELNYDIHNKKLLVIFKVFKIWWHYLERSASPIDIVIDYKNLEYFSTTKVLICFCPDALASNWMHSLDNGMSTQKGKIMAMLQWTLIISVQSLFINKLQHLSEQLFLPLQYHLLHLEGCWSKDNTGFLRLDNKMYILDNANLCLRVLQYHHNYVLVGHLGQNKILELVQRYYTWPNICNDIQRFCKSCVTCIRTKP